MHFDLVDRVLEHSGQRLVSVKQVSAAEEYLQDHFAGFPVLPGVLMLEAMVQAGRRLLELSDTPGASRLVLGGVRALKYGRFVRPGEVLRVEVVLGKSPDGWGGAYEFKGEGVVLTSGQPEPTDGPPTAVSGRFTLRPMAVG